MVSINLNRNTNVILIKLQVNNSTQEDELTPRKRFHDLYSHHINSFT